MPSADGRSNVEAVVCPRYGSPDVLRLERVAAPIPGPGEVLIRVGAAAVSVSDCVVRGARVKPAMQLPFRLFVGFRKPRRAVLGMELAGEVISTGAGATRFHSGDEVVAFTGKRFGAYAQYVAIPEVGKPMPFGSAIAPKPANVDYAHAAIVPTRGTLALYFLRKASVDKGQRVLIYGASGGVGTFALQIAKNVGAVVTAICSGANFDLVRSLGADFTFDYTVENAQATGGPYDVIFDAVGKRKSSPLKERLGSALARGGRSVCVDESAKIPADLLDEAVAMVAGGKLRPVLDRTYALAEAPEAHRYVERGHKRGGVALVIP